VIALRAVCGFTSPLQSITPFTLPGGGEMRRSRLERVKDAPTAPGKTFAQTEMILDEVVGSETPHGDLTETVAEIAKDS
jgi:hypothetical protein